MEDEGRLESIPAKGLNTWFKSQWENVMGCSEGQEEQEISPKARNQKCVVIMKVDLMPGAAIGWMPFQNFNPCIDKLNDEAEDIDDKCNISTTNIADQNRMNTDKNWMIYFLPLNLWKLNW